MEHYELEIKDFLHKGKSKKFRILGFEFDNMQTNSLWSPIPQSQSTGAGLGTMKSIQANSGVKVIMKSANESNIFHWKMLDQQVFPKILLFISRQKSSNIVELFDVRILSFVPSQDKLTGNEIDSIYFAFGKISMFSVEVKAVSSP